MKSFHNTTNESGQTLIVFTEKAYNQDELVFAFMKNHPNMGFTAQDIHNSLFDKSVPLTSSRRALSNLLKQNKVIKTNQKALGSFGRLQYKYIYQPNENLYINGR